jgi:general secretion pathway protein D
MSLEKKHNIKRANCSKIINIFLCIIITSAQTKMALAQMPIPTADRPSNNARETIVSSSQFPSNGLSEHNYNRRNSGIKWKNKSSKSLFNFSDTDIDVIIQAVAFAANKHVIIDPRVKGKISFSSEKPITAKEALTLLAPILRMRRYALIEDGQYIRVVPEEDARTIGSQVISKGKAPTNGQIFTQIFHLKYESASNLVAMIRNLIPIQNANTLVASQPNSSSNSIIVSDYADNLKRIAQIISVLDVPRQTNSSVQTITLNHAIAGDVAVTVSKILDNASNTNLPMNAGNNGSGADASKVNMTIDSRTNSIVLSSSNLQRLREYKALIASLDKPGEAQGNIWIVSLKNADANSVAQTLRAILSGDNTSSMNSSNSSSNRNNSNFNSGNGNNNSGNGNNSNNAGNSGANANFSATPNNSLGGQVQADVATNSLIISANPVQYRNLRTVIEKLDTQRAQVFVESMIVEMSDETVAELGVQWQGLIGGGSNRFYVGNSYAGNPIAQAGLGANTLLKLGNGSGSADLQSLASLSSGFNLGWLHQFGQAFGLSALAKALHNKSGVNILSTPNLLTLDNEEAKIIIGQNVPFITGQYTNNGANNSSVNPFQTIERNDVGLTLRVKPQVTSNGKVKLKIYQETSSVNDKSNISGIITNKRSIDTTVEVKNGEPIILGGLLEDVYSDGIEHIPGLSKIPLLGGLFRYEKKSRGKKNLMLLLRPYVVMDNAAELTTSRYDHIRQQQQNYQANVIGLSEKSYPVLPILPKNKGISGLDGQLSLGGTGIKSSINKNAKNTKNTNVLPIEFEQAKDEDVKNDVAALKKQKIIDSDNDASYAR